MEVNKVFNINSNLNIENIMVDSRTKLINAIFFCIVGLTNDSHNYVNQAINNGAICIVHSKELEEYQDGILYIKVEDTIKALNDFTSKFYDAPSKKMHVYGVTGTNGKTTIAWMMRDLLNRYEKSEYIGTLGYTDGQQTIEGYFTTLPVETLEKLLSEMVNKQVKSVAMEVSSQGLDGRRVDNIDFDVAIYTNLSHEHLDHHKTMENYFLSKAQFFQIVDAKCKKIICIDEEYGQRMLSYAHDNVFTYSINKEADYYASDIKEEPYKTTFVLHHDGQSYNVTTNIIAFWNVSNIIACIASMHQMGFDIQDLIKQVEHINPTPGRAQLLDEGQDFTVFVDYSNTPVGMRNALVFARNLVGDKKVYSIFGAAGDRDPSKRPLMGQMADELSDIVIVTKDDCHTEPFESVAKDIVAGVKNHTPIVIKERSEAIEYAIKNAQPGDCVALLGMGEQTFFKEGNGTTKIPYIGDYGAAQEAIRKYYRR